MLATTLPLLLRESLTDFGLEAVDRWWTELSEPSRKDVIQLWEEANLSGPAKAYVEARAVEDEAEEYNPALWHDDFYEYLVAHEVEYMPERRFHICTRHPVARAVVQRGWIPADFACPWEEGDAACPMRTILQRAQGGNLRVQIAWR